MATAFISSTASAVIATISIHTLGIWVAVVATHSTFINIWNNDHEMMEFIVTRERKNWNPAKIWHWSRGCSRRQSTSIPSASMLDLQYLSGKRIWPAFRGPMQVQVLAGSQFWLQLMHTLISLIYSFTQKRMSTPFQRHIWMLLWCRNPLRAPGHTAYCMHHPQFSSLCQHPLTRMWHNVTIYRHCSLDYLPLLWNVSYVQYITN